MTHRYFKFWREKHTGNVYSHSLCGEDTYIETYRSEEQWDFREALMENYTVANRAFARLETIDPQIVMETTASPSGCDECESLFGLTVLGAVG